MPDVGALTFLLRTNTVCIDINSAHPKGRCPRKEWVQFLTKDLGLKANDLVETQVHSITNFLMVKLKDVDIFSTVLEKLTAGVPWPQANQTVYGWSTQEVLVTVRIINLSCHVDVEKVKKKMAEYGTIAWSKLGFHQDLPGVRDGSLTLRMKLNEGVILPSFLDLESMGECLQIFSDVSEKVCFRCSRKGHIGAYCRAKVKDIPAEGTTSWAKIVGGHIPTVHPEERDAVGVTVSRRTGPLAQVPEAILHSSVLQPPTSGLPDYEVNGVMALEDSQNSNLELVLEGSAAGMLRPGQGKRSPKSGSIATGAIPPSLVAGTSTPSSGATGASSPSQVTGTSSPVAVKPQELGEVEQCETSMELSPLPSIRSAPSSPSPTSQKKTNKDMRKRVGTNPDLRLLTTLKTKKERLMAQI